MDTQSIKRRLYEDVRIFTSIKPARNSLNSASLNEAASYIENTFRKLNSRTEIQNFKVGGNDYKNVVTSFGPEDGPRIIVGAHYDVAGDQPGADDNASGVAGLLEIGRMLDALKAQLKYRIDLVAYSLEEPPHFATKNMGSSVHARSLKEKKVNVKAMICLEMIGYFSDEPNSQSFPDPSMARIYPNKGNFIVVVGKTGQEIITNTVKKLMINNCEIDVQSINLPADEYLAGLSDHRNYWAEGYDAVMINDTSFLRNPNYHKTSDTIETLNFDKMAEVVKGVFGMITSL